VLGSRGSGGVVGRFDVLRHHYYPIHPPSDSSPINTHHSHTRWPSFHTLPIDPGLLNVPQRRGLATAGNGGKEEEEGDDAAKQRRLEALKRFGLPDDFKDTEGKPVVQAQQAKGEVGKAGGGKGEGGGKKEGEEEPDWNEIWGDYVAYMDHQRTQGWKT
jgi:hypothetical protein